MSQNRFAKAAQKAKEITNKQLADEIAAVSKLSRENINQLLPLKKDKEAFAELMAQVESDTDMDTKLNFLKGNIDTVGKVAFTVLKALV